MKISYLQAIAATLAAAGCMPVAVNPHATEIAALDGNLVAGEALYTEYCAECHGADGKGTQRSLHGDTPVNFTTAAHWYSADEFITMIIDGIPETDMKPWNHLSDQDVADIYAHILALPRD